MINDKMKHLSLTTKLLMLTYAIILTISFLFGTLFYRSSRDYIIDRVRTTSEHTVRQINSNIRVLQKDVYDISTFIVTNPSTLDFLRSDDSNASFHLKDYVESSDLKDSLLNLVISKEYLTHFSLYRDGLDFSPYYVNTDSSIGILPYSSIKASDIYQKVAEENGSAVWFKDPEEGSILFERSRSPKIILARTIKNPNNYQPIGTLFLGFSEVTLTDSFSGSLLNESEGIAVIDSSGQLLTASGIGFYHPKLFERTLSETDDNVFLAEDDGDHFLYTYSANNLGGWTVIYAIDSTSLKGEMQQRAIVIFILVGLCATVSLTLMYLLSRWLLKPIKALLVAMNRFKSGDFKATVSVRSQDEIGQLSDVYNAMVKEIKTLIDQNYILTIKEKEAELNALQAQINPHFLYNTLDTIYWNSMEQGDSKTANMVYMLSKLFRLSLNGGRDFISIRKETEILTYYLDLQKIRYSDNLSYKMDVTRSAMTCQIPRFILQPFVENAILHGLEPKEGGGTVTVTGRLTEGWLTFTIEDDGVGMTANSMNPEGSHYAIHNIEERLQLYYKDNYTLAIESQPEQGTKVTLTIPESKGDDFNA